MKSLSLAHRSIALFCLLVGVAWILPAQVLVLNDIRATEGYRLVARLNETDATLIDKNDNVVHRWTSKYQLSSVAYLMPNGDLLRTCIMGNPTITAGGAAGRIELLAWDSSVTWAYEYNLPNATTHHDVKLLPNGNFLILIWEYVTRDEAIAAGIDPGHVTSKGIFFESLIEVKPKEGFGGDIVWKWRLLDHMVQDIDPNKPNYGTASEHPELVNVHFAANPSTADWFHANGIDYNPDLDQIVISVRAISEVWIIDHSTTTEEAASHSGGRQGKGGDLLYRWGNPGVWGGGGADRQQIDVQHNAHWIKPGLQGSGHLLIFSNLIPGQSQKSRVVEIELPLLPDGSYYREEGKEFGPDGFVWSYESATPNDFYSSFISGAERLPNGNTLICSGGQGRILEVTPEKEVLWDYWDGGVGNTQRVNIFRSYWYPSSFEGFKNSPLYQPPLTVLNGGTIRPGPVGQDSLVYAAADSFVNSTVEILDGSGKTLPAALNYVEPSSMTFVVPAQAQPGPGRVIVRNSTGQEYRVEIRIDPTAPGLFAASGTGEGVGAIYIERADTGEIAPAFYFNDAAFEYQPAPISVQAMEGGVYLLIPATGIRAAIPDGSIEVALGDVTVPVADIQAQDLPGVDMIKAGPLPMVLASTGVQQVVVTAAGKKSNAVLVALQ